MENINNEKSKEVVMYIINDKKEILLQKRSAIKRYNPNKWCLCAGHVENFDNSFIDAAIREIKEELGVDVPKEELQILGIKEDKLHVTYFYYITINKNEEEFVIRKEELSEVRWYDINTVIKMMIGKDISIIFTDKILELLKKLNSNL